MWPADMMEPDEEDPFSTALSFSEGVSEIDSFYSVPPPPPKRPEPEPEGLPQQAEDGAAQPSSNAGVTCSTPPTVRKTSIASRSPPARSPSRPPGATMDASTPFQTSTTAAPSTSSSDKHELQVEMREEENEQEEEERAASPIPYPQAPEGLKRSRKSLPLEQSASIDVDVSSSPPPHSTRHNIATSETKTASAREGPEQTSDFTHSADLAANPAPPEPQAMPPPKKRKPSSVAGSEPPRKKERPSLGERELKDLVGRGVVVGTGASPRQTRGQRQSEKDKLPNAAGAAKRRHSKQ